MKIRNGFVSNSSSSSFVIAFPKKPKNFADVYEMMFHGKEGGIQPYDFVDGMSHTQVSERVWQDLQQKGKRPEWADYVIPAKLKDVVETFRNRYHYTPNNHNVFWTGRKDDEFGGAWREDIGPYCGRDIESMNKLRDFIIKTENEERAIRDRQSEIFKREFKVPSVPYAYKGGKNNKTGSPYTKKQIDAFKAYQHAMDTFKKEHKEYAKFEKRLSGSWEKKYKTEDILRKKIATSDAKAFMQDNKGTYIVILSYADNDGDCTMEHGNIFKNLNHVTISNH